MPQVKHNRIILKRIWHLESQMILYLGSLLQCTSISLSSLCYHVIITTCSKICYESCPPPLNLTMAWWKCNLYLLAKYINELILNCLDLEYSVNVVAWWLWGIWEISCIYFRKQIVAGSEWGGWVNAAKLFFSNSLVFFAFN
jgi:hypothetical protein